MNVAIIGAGASGLFLANILNKYKIKYTIYNNGKIGRKILASGNGKCNISNKLLDIDKYHNSELARYLINNYKDKLFSYFSLFKIYTKELDDNRLYPISESSQSVLNILTKNVNNIVDMEINNIVKKNNKYIINNQEYDYVVIGVGTPANLDNYNYSLFDCLNIKLNSFKPSLVGFKLKENVKKISGVRAKAYVSLYNDNKLIHEENGEIIFKDDGISGICIMNLSSYYNKLKSNNPYIKIKLLDKNYDDLTTVINPKLLSYIIDNKLNPYELKFNIKSTYEMKFAQVASGGIDINMLDEKLRYKNDLGLFFMGEVIDVDGICGGFNLSFAFLSAICVGEALNEISNK